MLSFILMTPKKYVIKYFYLFLGSLFNFKQVLVKVFGILFTWKHKIRKRTT